MPQFSVQSLKELYLSHKGRMARKPYNLYVLLPYMVLDLLFSGLDIALGTYDEMSGIGVLSTIFILVTLWPMVVTTTKRLHDRNISGWRQVAYFVVMMIGGVLFGVAMEMQKTVLMILGAGIALASIVWVMVELCFLKGTDGTNKYGDDPLKQV